MLADGPDEICGDPAEIEPPTSPTRPDRDQPHDHRGGAEAGGDKEDRLLRHRRRGGRHPQDSDEQLPTLHRQPAGDSGDILYLVSYLLILMYSLQSLDNKIHETVETINSLKTSREFFLSFAKVEQVSVELTFVTS